MYAKYGQIAARMYSNINVIHKSILPGVFVVSVHFMFMFMFCLWYQQHYMT